LTDALGIPIMMLNNPATSGIDMSANCWCGCLRPSTTSELSKRPPVTFPGCSGSTSLAAAGRRSPTAVSVGVWDGLLAGAAGWGKAARCLRPQPCIDLYDAVRTGELRRARTIYAELRPLLGFIAAGGLATTVKAGPELRGAGVGDSRPPLLPLDDGGRAVREKVLTDA
jgi:4-hydroxy-tetrahydrodipicolinate synthase